MQIQPHNPMRDIMFGISVRTLEFVNVLLLACTGLVLLTAGTTAVVLPKTFPAEMIDVRILGSICVAGALVQLITLWSACRMCRRISSVVLILSALLWGLIAMLNNFSPAWIDEFNFGSVMSAAYVILAFCTFGGSVAIQDHLHS